MKVRRECAPDRFPIRQHFFDLAGRDLLYLLGPAHYVLAFFVFVAAADQNEVPWLSLVVKNVVVARPPIRAWPRPEVPGLDAPIGVQAATAVEPGEQRVAAPVVVAALAEPALFPARTGRGPDFGVALALFADSAFGDLPRGELQTGELLSRGSVSREGQALQAAQALIRGFRWIAAPEAPTWPHEPNLARWLMDGAYSMIPYWPMAWE